MAEQSTGSNNSQFNNVSKPAIAHIDQSDVTGDIIVSYDGGPFIPREDGFVSAMCFRKYEMDIVVSDPEKESGLFYLDRDTGMYDPLMKDDFIVFVKPVDGEADPEFESIAKCADLVQAKDGQFALILGDVNQEDKDGFINGTIHSRDYITPVKTERYSFSELFEHPEVPAFQSGLEDSVPG